HIYYLNATEISNLINGDVAYCFKKESLVKNPFPRIEDEKFVPELYIWNKITDKAKIRFNISKVIYLCEYLDDGLSKNFHNQLKKYPKGFK
ncbi:glycosyltransferase family 2 protein, partial [Escherichia coli]|nr:glycosyltransferase family 2 protein [Escherichia coli]